eukprot:CAMPEP_0115336800 /NCGR_PEP_ID=MMETSP0270-20121206/89193_1 /TAXON_ID=71861 /ORGANISM="Scrippsiella trochoidea, Strain CCMP3099" /LENGTH=523 /DNA_ID=CAMNT_0002757985 /DNA_START=74 /DNA_END=1647 /DNA_ORIENTATION=+
MARSVQRVEGGRTRTCAATIVRLDFGVRQVGCGPVVWPGAAIAKMSMPINEIPWQGTSPILPLVQGEDCVGCPVRMHQAEVVVRAASPPRGVASASHRNLVRGRGDSHIRCGDTVPAHHHVGDEPTMRPTEEEDHFTVDVVLRDHPIRDVDDVLVLTRVLVEIEFNTQDGRGEHDAIAVLLECRACCSEQTFTHVTGIVILRSVQRNDQRTLQVHCSAGWRTLNEEGSVDRGVAQAAAGSVQAAASTWAALVLAAASVLESVQAALGSVQVAPGPVQAVPVSARVARWGGGGVGAGVGGGGAGVGGTVVGAGDSAGGAGVASDSLAKLLKKAHTSSHTPSLAHCAQHSPTSSLSQTLCLNTPVCTAQGRCLAQSSNSYTPSNTTVVNGAMQLDESWSGQACPIFCSVIWHGCVMCPMHVHGMEVMVRAALLRGNPMLPDPCDLGRHRGKCDIRIRDNGATHKLVPQVGAMGVTKKEHFRPVNVVCRDRIIGNIDNMLVVRGVVINVPVRPRDRQCENNAELAN